MLMQKIIFAFLISIGSLFAGQNDFLGVLQQILEAAAEGQQTSNPQQKATSKSLAEEAADKKAIEQRQEEQKNEYIRQFNEKIVPRLKNLEAFNEQFYQKYLIKDVDTPEIIDEKFKNRIKLFREMVKDHEAYMQEYQVLDEIANEMCRTDSSNCQRPSELRQRNSNQYVEWSSFIFGYSIEDYNYEAYLREAYETYDARKQHAKQEEDRKKQYAKVEAENEAKNKMILAERKKVEPACKKWRAEANRKVYSLGIGDTVVYTNGGSYVIEAINTNTFTVPNPEFKRYVTRQKLGLRDVVVPSQYVYLQKEKCIPQAAIQSAPSQYCYQ